MKVVLKIGGITCKSCIAKISEVLQKDKNVREYKMKGSKAYLSLKNINNVKKTKKAIEELGYTVEVLEDSKLPIKTWLQLIVVIGILGIIQNSMLARGSSLMGNGSVNLAILFLVGLFSSFHCVGMCGGITLALGEKGNKHVYLYHTGRVLSYALLGGLIGVLGESIAINDMVYSLLPLVIGVLMLLVSLNYLGVIYFTLPTFKLCNASIKKKFSNSSLLLGLLGGLMPCGILQMMQLYALSSGSFLNGFLSMFVFALGTTPLLLGFNKLIKKITIKQAILTKASGLLILMLSFNMINNGLALNGITTISLDMFKSNTSNSGVTVEKDGVQRVDIDLNLRGYQDITVKSGIPVEFAINVDKENLTYCNNGIVIPQYGIEQSLVEGENIIRFTPTEKGQVNYSCWMGMLRNTITVE